MTARLQRHASTLRLLSKAKPSLAKGIIKTGGDDLIKCICECAHNVLRGNVPLSRKQTLKLKKHKQSLRSLANKSTGVKRKRKIIQTGGFLGTLLATVIPAIASILGGIAGGKR